MSTVCNEGNGCVSVGPLDEVTHASKICVKEAVSRGRKRRREDAGLEDGDEGRRRPARPAHPTVAVESVAADESIDAEPTQIFGWLTPLTSPTWQPHLASWHRPDGTPSADQTTETSVLSQTSETRPSPTSVLLQTAGECNAPAAVAANGASADATVAVATGSADARTVMGAPADATVAVAIGSADARTVTDASAESLSMLMEEVEQVQHGLAAVIAVHTDNDHRVVRVAALMWSVEEKRTQLETKLREWAAQRETIAYKLLATPPSPMPLSNARRTPDGADRGASEGLLSEQLEELCRKCATATLERDLLDISVLRLRKVYNRLVADHGATARAIVDSHQRFTFIHQHISTKPPQP